MWYEKGQTSLSRVSPATAKSDSKGMPPIVRRYTRTVRTAGSRLQVHHMRSMMFCVGVPENPVKMTENDWEVLRTTEYA